MAKHADLEIALKNMVYQFAYRSPIHGRLHLHSGGLSALEDAFAALNYPDPMSCPEAECQQDGCHEEATCGTPTPDGYVWLCEKHMSMKMSEKREKTVTNPAMSQEAELEPAAMSRYEELLRRHKTGVANNLYAEMCQLAETLESELDTAIKEGLRLTILS